MPTRAMRLIRLALASVSLCMAFAAPPAFAEQTALDRWPDSLANDQAALQRGARLFVNYCLNCHSATLMRWNRLHDIGIDDGLIRSELIFGGQKVGDVMTVAMSARDAKNWFGKAPPDLSVIIRARDTAEHSGTDYVYSLLRGFYRDRSTLTGWNNVVYPNISMPNILWQRQGPRTATISRVDPVSDASEKGGRTRLVRLTTNYDVDGSSETQRTDADKATSGMEVAFSAPDPKRTAAYDADVADLVAYLNWMSEPSAASRYKIGVWAMGLLVVFFLLARWLNQSYWRNVT